MSLEAKTTAEVSTLIISGLEAEIGQTIPVLPKAFARVLAKVLAGVFILLFKYSGFVFLQLFVRHASMAETTINGTKLVPLIEWGRLIGVSDPTPAEQAEHVVSVTVQDQTGSLPAGSLLLRAETGVVYSVVSAVTLNAPTVQATVKAVSDQTGGDGSGTIGNLEAGDLVSFANPIPQVATDAAVVSTAVTGADAETPDSYRNRVLARFQNKPQGGAYADYRTWSEEVAGIVRAYPYTGFPGEVDVYIEATEASSGSADGIPTQAQLEAVADAIDLDSGGLATNRPASAAVNVLPITRAPFDLIVNTLEALSTESQDAIEQGIDEHLRSREPFIVGLSVLPRVDRITQAAMSGIVDTIASAEGGTVVSIELQETGEAIVARVLQHGEKARLGNVTYET